MTKYADLIARLEQAKEGSRELDGDIALLLPSDEGPVLTRALAKSYTTSLDAALTLIPERAADGLYWRFFLERKPTHDTMAWIATTREHGKDGWEAIGHSAPLAICAVALTVRAAQARSRSDDSPAPRSGDAPESIRGGAARKF